VFICGFILTRLLGLIRINMAEGQSCSTISDGSFLYLILTESANIFMGYMEKLIYGHM
jgi:hypothetical protein